MCHHPGHRDVDRSETACPSPPGCSIFAAPCTRSYAGYVPVLPPKYLIFFKGRDADALTAAFTEYTNKKVKKATKTERPSVLAKLNQFKEMVKNAVVDRTKRKELER